MAYSNICVGISGRGDEHRVITHSLALAQGLGARITFLHVNDKLAGALSLAFLDHGERLDQDTLARYVQTEAGGEAADVGNASFEIREGDWLQILVELSASFDCLVLGHHHVGSITELFTLSKDEQVINRAACPVLVIPADTP